jgi:hypothetical protein
MRYQRGGGDESAGSGARGRIASHSKKSSSGGPANQSTIDITDALPCHTTPLGSETDRVKIPSVMPALTLPCASGLLATRQMDVMAERSATTSATTQ